MDGWTNSAVIPKLLRLGLHWGMHDNLHPNAKGMIPKLLRLGLHWGALKAYTLPVSRSRIPKLLRLGLHWGSALQNAEKLDEQSLSFYA